MTKAGFKIIKNPDNYGGLTSSMGASFQGGVMRLASIKSEYSEPNGKSEEYGEEDYYDEEFDLEEDQGNA